MGANEFIFKISLNNSTKKIKLSWRLKSLSIKEYFKKSVHNNQFEYQITALYLVSHLKQKSYKNVTNFNLYYRARHCMIRKNYITKS